MNADLMPFGHDPALLVGMKVGGLRKLIVPSEKAYGRAGVGSTIPPNATLVFEVEVLSLVAG